jgi:hypothetical protein
MALVFASTNGIAVAQSFTQNDLNSINAGTAWYDPFSGLCGSTENAGDISVAEGNSNIATAYNFFTDKAGPGLSTMQAAAIIGNMEQESGPGLHPKVVNSIGATGIAQWLGGRKENLFKYASDHNLDKWDIKTQLAFLWYEVTQGTEKVYNAVGALKGASTLRDAVTQWELKFERAGVDEANIPARVKYAQVVIDQVKSGKLGTGEITSASETGGTGAVAAVSECPNSGAGGTSVSLDGFTIYNQCDKAWGANPYGSTGKTICSSGCGPSTMAMIITAFTKQRVTPAQTIAYANTKGLYIPGSGSSWTVAPVLAEHWGLTSKKIGKSVSAVNAALKAGGMVAMSGTGPKPFTSKGHYITIRGITPDGKWMIGDSAHSDTSAKPWDPSFIISYATEGGMYAIYPGSKAI